MSTLKDLAEAFQALSNENRLKILNQLREPHGYNEIMLAPTRDQDPHGSPNRTISRQAVRKHIKKLAEHDLVAPTNHEGNKNQYVVNHARLFALFEQARNLASNEPTIPPQRYTLDLQDPHPPPAPTKPHLALAKGVQEGRTFPLDQETTLIGRDSNADVPLTYDAFTSTRHARILKQDDTHLLHDLPENKNGTTLNWRPLKKGATAPLTPGDAIGIGRSLLIYRA